MQHNFFTLKAWCTPAIIKRTFQAFWSFPKESERVGMCREQNLQCRMTGVGNGARTILGQGGKTKGCNAKYSRAGGQDSRHQSLVSSRITVLRRNWIAPCSNNKRSPKIKKKKVFTGYGASFQP